MQLSKGEKLILLALADLRDGRKEIDLDFIRRAIFSGHLWALDWEITSLAEDDAKPEIAKETADILAMWGYIEHSVAQLTPAEQKQLEDDAYPYSLSFSGFDGNNDPHHSVAHFLIHDMNRFDGFKGRALNSHTQSSLPHYRRMLTAYNTAIHSSNFSSRSLSAEQILQIVKPK